MSETAPGSGRWIVSRAKNGQTLLEIVPDAWQGNANVYPVDGAVRVGHLWSQFLMLSPGRWLTDRAESEGQKLVSFEVLQNRGRWVSYRGAWKFRDYFITKAEHSIWIRQETVCHWVRTDLTVLQDIPRAGAVWVEFMNDAGAYSTIAVKTAHKVIELLATGRTDTHHLDGEVLGKNGWIAIYGPRNGQDSSAALVALEGSHPVRPRFFDAHVDTIELHMLDPRTTRTLRKGHVFRLEYVLLVSREADNCRWIDGDLLSTMLDKLRKGCIPFNGSTTNALGIE